MEVFMQSISFSTTKRQLSNEIARVLHGPDFTQDSTLPLNFHIHLFADKRGGHNHSGQGALTLPSSAVGARFLSQYGGAYPEKTINAGNRTIKFSPSKRTPRVDVVESIQRLPYLNAQAVEEREQREADLRSEVVSIKTIQFGWECRDSVFSIEWERPCAGLSFMLFDAERREIRIKIRRLTGSTLIIAIRFSQISVFNANVSLSDESVIFFSLDLPPVFESENPFAAARPGERDVKRHRLSYLDHDHERVAPYTSLAIRLVCSSVADLKCFRRLSGIAQLQNLMDFDYLVERRGLFSEYHLRELEEWLSDLEWCVAFQVDALVRSLAVDVVEMLSLRDAIEEVVEKKDGKYASALLRHFAPRAKALYWDSNESEESRQSILDCFAISETEWASIQTRSPAPRPLDSVFDCLHVLLTPTAMGLEGPFPERSNRVIRSYPQHYDCFLRVSFVDEGRLQYRFDREVDGPHFVKSRLSGPLLQGLRVAGREFQFLAYSQSALKEHAVWFIMPFIEDEQRYVDASTIVESIGIFKDLTFDPELIYCPARYGARISQAFTATDLSISVEVEEIMYLDDIKIGKWCFTDGVGTISRALAKEIWGVLRTTRRKGKHKAHPSAYQVRFMGSKGMLSIDYKLSGRAVCLRPSMIKFNALTSRDIEIARSFDKPGRYFLNRPLIMILEGLGVPYETFKQFQDAAISEVQHSTETLNGTARLLEAYGLGTSFRLTSVMLSLANLDISPPSDNFYGQMIEFAVHDIMRDLKQRAHIEVPGGWTLVGVADIHGCLRDGEIFACISPPDRARIYLEGPVLVSRSPTIHPGDVQIAHAIGRPPAGSSFAREPLPNTVVFSVEGLRPLPSCLGGGDLDGDTYNIIPLDNIPSLIPKRLCKPASYDPAPKKTLNRPSTMADVAEFIMEYINSDVLGIIAINWLIIADQSTEGIFDPDCLRLSCLHSDAVDYPKSGQPVALDDIPRLKFRAKPDWNAPETVNPDNADFYKSRRAIGRLFRAIDLPAVKIASAQRARHRRHHVHEQEPNIEDIMENLHMNDSDEDGIPSIINDLVSPYISNDLNDPNMIERTSHLFLRFASELQAICEANSLFKMPLTEEEAIVGTIVAKSSQPRKRKDLMSRMREQTGILVRGVLEEISGDEDRSLFEWLEHAWAAWRISLAKREAFGAKSFGWIALSGIFESLKQIEDSERVAQRVNT